MLDVHPAHHAASSWREFFIHIATIVLGLLIAISLEQTVELFHHRHLAEEAREALRIENHRVKEVLELNVYTTQHHMADLHRDLAIVAAIRASRPLASQLFIVRRFGCCSYPTDAWKTIHEAGTINYLKPEDLVDMEYLYGAEDGFNVRLRENKVTLMHAASVLINSADPPRSSVEDNLANTHFLEIVTAAHGHPTETDQTQGYERFVEHSDLSKLPPGDLDTLEHALKTAIIDDEFLITDCANIQRTLERHASRGY